jgi:hypothetical protein
MAICVADAGRSEIAGRGPAGQYGSGGFTAARHQPMAQRITMGGGTMRPSGRQPEQLREIRFETGFPEHAEGACLIALGRTRVLCTATLEERVPPFVKGSGQGWVTAEYGMLPRAKMFYDLYFFSTGTKDIGGSRPGLYPET